MSASEAIGEVANVAQFTGIDPVRLISLIVKNASTARSHKKTCIKFAQHLKLVGDLLEELKISELKKYPEIREPLEQMEKALIRSYILINSCQDRGNLYLLAMGWNIVYQFRRAQDEIDSFLRIMPLVILVDNARARERLEDIEKDQREYTLDEEDSRIPDVILKPDPSKNDTMVLKKTLEVANVAQLTGIDAVRLIALIVKAASTARSHKKNCIKFAQHVKLVGNLLEELKISELKKYPVTREPLEELEEALRRSYFLINSCQNRSNLYLLAMGWNIIYQFRSAQDEIDRFLQIIPIIGLVYNAPVTVL